MTKAVVLVVGAGWLLGAASAQAQTAADRPVRQIEAGFGAGLLGGTGLGAADANLRANSSGPQPFRLFATNSDVARTPVWYARVGFALTRRLVLEGSFARSTPEIRVEATGDVEGAPPITAIEAVDQYFIDASAVVMLDELRIGRQLVPFVAAGAGYLRQLHEGQTLVEQGEVYHAGGGVKYWLLARRTGLVRTAGVRGDATVYFLRRGISFDDHLKSHVAISGGAFVGF
jgi:hypothetical protein